MITYKSFTSIPNGTRIYNHYYDQCVALANLYHEDVIGGAPVPSNSAYEWWTGFAQRPMLQDLYVQSAAPVPGAIFVARGGIYDSANGHIGVVTGLAKGGYFETMEQNAGERYLGRYIRSMQNILGFLIPKNNPAAPAANHTEEEVIPYHRQDTLSRNGGRTLRPGSAFYLHTDPKAPTSGAVNCIGGVGQYLLIAHIYAVGDPGDEVILRYVWQTDPKGAKPVNSAHYTQRYMIPESGILQESVSFTRYAGGSKPQAVYLWCQAAPDNKSPVKITVLDSDALCFKKG